MSAAPAGKGTAVKVWEERQYQDLDDSVQIGTRNIKVALRRLRKFAREGSADQLDLADTIRSTARNAGYARYQDGCRAPQCGQGTYLF